MLNSQFLPKVLPKEGSKSLKTPEKNVQIIENLQIRVDRTLARLPVHMRTVCRAPTHGRAPGVRVPVHLGTTGRAPVLPRVHGRAPLLHARVLRCFSLLCYP